MPKAKYKRKGAIVDPGGGKQGDATVDAGSGKLNLFQQMVQQRSCKASILDLPEEMMRQILSHLPMSGVGALERTCRQLKTVICQARIWRRILLDKVECEPELRVFLPDLTSLEEQETGTKVDSEVDSRDHKRLLENLQLKLDYAWMSAHPATVNRTSRVFGDQEENHFLYHVITTGRHFVSFWSPVKTDSRHQHDYIVDIYDRSTLTKVRRLTDLHGKPDIVRVVSELNLLLISYPGMLMVELVRLEGDGDRGCCGEQCSSTGPLERDYLDLAAGLVGDTTGSICDICVREQISLSGTLHPRVVLVAMNTEPVDNRQFHIGQVTMFSLGPDCKVSTPLWSTTFRPVPLQGGSGGRFFNQCIQKKGLCDFTDSHLVVVIGGCEGSAVLAVVDLPTKKVKHKLQLRGEQGGGGRLDQEGGCEGGACQYSVVSLLIDKLNSDLCAVLLSTGQLNVIHLPSGNTVFHRHLQFDGQLKLALHQPRLLGTQRIAIKFRNFVTFYDLHMSRVETDIRLTHVRTLRIISVDGRETRLDDNPSQELRRQFGELQKRVRALNNYTSGIQKKLDKGLRPGTVTQGVLSMTRKVQLVTSKLDQAHGKAREIEAIVIASFAFDNRFCHALTLNRDLVVFDLFGALETYNLERKEGATSSGVSSRVTRNSVK